MSQIQHNIPTEQDWQGYQDDMDARYAYDIFFGKTLSEVQPAFQRNVIVRAWELRFIPVKAFQYYIFALRDYIIDENFNAHDAEDADCAVDCYFSLVQFKLDKYPEHILPVMEELLPSLHFIPTNLAAYNFDEEIYGSIPARLQTLLQSYRQLCQQT